MGGKLLGKWVERSTPVQWKSCSGVGPCLHVSISPEGFTWAPGRGHGAKIDYWFSSAGMGVGPGMFSRPNTTCGWTGTVSDHVPLFTSVMLRKAETLLAPRPQWISWPTVWGWRFR